MGATPVQANYGRWCVCALRQSPSHLEGHFALLAISQRLNEIAEHQLQYFTSIGEMRFLADTPDSVL